jgi:hypothetical protein
VKKRVTSWIIVLFQDFEQPQRLWNKKKLSFHKICVLSIERGIEVYITNECRIKTMYFLLHSYENLCSCFHKYLFTYLFSMYNYYVTTILLSWILHTCKLCQNLWKLNFQFPSQIYFMKIFILTRNYSYQVKVFPNITNTHLYTNQKKIK